MCVCACICVDTSAGPEPSYQVCTSDLAPAHRCGRRRAPPRAPGARAAARRPAATTTAATTTLASRPAATHHHAVEYQPDNAASKGSLQKQSLPGHRCQRVRRTKWCARGQRTRLSRSAMGRGCQLSSLDATKSCTVVMLMGPRNLPPRHRKARARAHDRSMAALAWRAASLTQAAPGVVWRVAACSHLTKHSERTHSGRTARMTGSDCQGTSAPLVIQCARLSWCRALTRPSLNKACAASERERAQRAALRHARAAHRQPGTRDDYRLLCLPSIRAAAGRGLPMVGADRLTPGMARAKWWVVGCWGRTCCPSPCCRSATLPAILCSASQSRANARQAGLSSAYTCAAPVAGRQTTTVLDRLVVRALRSVGAREGSAQAAVGVPLSERVPAMPCRPLPPGRTPSPQRLGCGRATWTKRARHSGCAGATPGPSGRAIAGPERVRSVRTWMSQGSVEYSTVVRRLDAVMTVVALGMARFHELSDSSRHSQWNPPPPCHWWWKCCC